MDTSPAASGENVNPQIHRNYDGGDIIVNKEKNIVLSPSEFSILSQNWKNNNNFRWNNSTWCR